METNGKRPEVVCLCGSTRFKDAFLKAQLDLTLAGKIVVTVGGFGHADHDKSPEEVWGLEQKQALDRLHKWKIDMADTVLVLNVGGYVGDSTKSEIAFAVCRAKNIQFLEPNSSEAIFDSLKGLAHKAVVEMKEMGLLPW